MRTSTASWIGAIIATLMVAALVTATMMASAGIPLPVLADPTPSVTPTPTPSATPTPSTPTPRATPRLANPAFPVAYAIPDAAALRPTDFAWPLVAMGDEGDYPRSPIVMGQACNEGRRGLGEPISGRAWSWAEEDSNNLKQWAVDQNVTGWPDAAAAFRELRANTGQCRFIDRLTVVEDSDARWVAHLEYNGIPSAVAVARAGEVLVGVRVVAPQGATSQQHVTEAKRLVAIAAERAAASGIGQR